MSAPLRLCAHLRWRAFYQQQQRWPSVEALQEALLRGDRPFSCLHTCHPWGPDDDVTAPEACQPGRGCFELSERDPSGPTRAQS